MYIPTFVIILFLLFSDIGRAILGFAIGLGILAFIACLALGSVLMLVGCVMRFV